MVTIGDMVAAQKALIDHLGIDKLLCVVGGSIGGMQVLEWSVRYPEMVFAAIPLATTMRHSALAIAFNEVARQAIMADPHWNHGDYYGGEKPGLGLAVARMIGHITYLSDESMRLKFGRRLQDKNDFSFDFDADFQVESYLRYQGTKFVERFDANSFLYITKAADYFDLGKQHGDGSAVKAFAKAAGQVPGDLLHLGLALPDLPGQEYRQGPEKKRAGCEFLRNRGRVGPRRVSDPQRTPEDADPRIPGAGAR